MSSGAEGVCFVDLIGAVKAGLRLDDLAAATAAIEQARGAARTAAELSELLDVFGGLLSRAGDLPRALDHHLLAATVAREGLLSWDGVAAEQPKPPEPDAPSLEPLSEATALGHVGALSQLAARPGLARRALERAVAVSESVEGRWALKGELFHNFGVVLSVEGDHEEAQRWLERALEVDRERGDQGAEHADLCRLAVLARRRGALDEARDLASMARDIAADALRVAERAESHLLLGSVAFSGGALAEALAEARAAIDLLEAEPEERRGPTHSLSLGRAYVDTAVYARNLGRPRAAMRSLERAAEHATVSGNAALRAVIAREVAALGS